MITRAELLGSTTLYQPRFEPEPTWPPPTPDQIVAGMRNALTAAVHRVPRYDDLRYLPACPGAIATVGGQSYEAVGFGHINLW